MPPAPLAADRVITAVSPGSVNARRYHPGMAGDQETVTAAAAMTEANWRPRAELPVLAGLGHEGMSSHISEERCSFSGAPRLPLSAFYQHAARSGVDLGELLVTWQPAGRRGTARRR